MKLVFYLLAFFLVTTFATEENSTQITNSTVPLGPSVCKQDAEKFCPNQDDYRSVGKCLKAHLNELSSECSSFVSQKMAQRQAAKEACGADSARLCPRELHHLKSGGRHHKALHALRQCLLVHYSNLSESCSAFVQKRLNEIPADACDADAAQFCSDSKGFSAILTCVKDHFYNVSHNCKMLIRSPSLQNPYGFFSRHHDGHGGRHGDGRRGDGRHGDGRHGGGENGGGRHGGGRHGGGENGGGRHGGDENGGGRHGGDENGGGRHGGDENGGGRHGGGENGGGKHGGGREAMKACKDDVKQFCYEERKQGYAAVRDCLYEHEEELSDACASYLYNGEESSYDDDDHHFGMFRHHVWGIVLLVAGAALLCCICKRCKQRRMRRMAATQQLQRFIPLQTFSSDPESQTRPQSPSSSSTSTQPEYSTNQPMQAQTVVYAPSPFTGGVPLTATPIAYNPDAVTRA